MALIIAIAAVAVLLLAVFLAVIGGMAGTAAPGVAACQPAPGPTATAQIPADYLALYVKAGAEYGLPWPVLAAIGAVESDHGRGPGAGIRAGTNPAGAAGPMQFMPGTWQTYGVDGNGDGRRDVYDPADAIPAAARLLRANGAPADMERAIYAYNHADWYVRKVMDRAATYGVLCADVSVATGRAAVAVRAALRWVGTPYSWGGGGLSGPTEGFGRGAGIVGFDCSGLTRYAWYQAGVLLPRTSQEQWRTLPHIPAGAVAPGDLVFFKGALGTATAPGHVGIVLGDGRMIEAPRTGLSVRVSPIGGRADLVGYARPGATWPGARK